MKRFTVALVCFAAAASLGFMAASAPAGAIDGGVGSPVLFNPSSGDNGPRLRSLPGGWEISGAVVDGDLQPVADANVTVLRCLDGCQDGTVLPDSDLAEQASYVTDADGLFAGIVPADQLYVVRVDGPDYDTTVYAPGVADLADAGVYGSRSTKLLTTFSHITPPTLVGCMLNPVAVTGLPTIQC
jgi:hypothetical protein